MSMMDKYILELSEKFYQNSLDCNELTKDINKINKYYLPFIPKHKLIYKSLPFYNYVRRLAPKQCKCK